jgi:pilus assembly protein Flp/PilA
MIKKQEKVRHSSITRFLSDERGATAVEYTLLAATIALVIVVVLPLVGGSLKDRFQMVMDAFTN